MNDTRPAVDLPRVVLAIGTVLLLIGGSLYILLPFVPAFIWGTMIVVTTWPVLLSVQHRLGERRGLAVVIMLLLQVVVIVVPVFGAISTLADHAADITAFVKGLPDYALPSPPHWLAAIPVVGVRIAHEWQSLSDAGPGGVLAKLQPYAAIAARWLLARVSQAGLFMLHLLLMLVVCGLLYANGEVAARLVTRLAQRVAPYRGTGIVHLIGQSIRAIALGVVVTAVVQAALGALGIWIAGVPFAGVLAALLLIVCLVQIGPFLPLMGCVAWLFIHDARLAAILLFVWSIGVTGLDNFMRPILIRRAVSLPMMLIISGVLGGLLSIGVVGLFIGPVVLAVTYHLLLAWIDTPGASEAAADTRTPNPAAPPADTTPD
ncbi:putative PurR-regulated permease PerM [Paraburkholderia sp. BL23I1N1]|uniref:AI-2E family transporter YdiK n=1 Tax=Paraburkholderia sp. BL23I1N1 TaxID=1938802 RepID=UPI000E771709|nr:AI-2E family transporter YdiK [Paraburkholderia sp. BL23I1N1]RKE39452.1 putative PurR-regulated permease PerM [Paraburkholderia sp. BL23I1N1]